MKHLLLLFITLSIFLVSCGDDEDSPTSPTVKKAEPLLPLAVGNEWVYSLEEYWGDELTQTTEVTTVITEKKQATYKGQEVTAFKQVSTGGGEAWHFVLDSKMYSCMPLDSIENSTYSPNSISIEEAATMEQITFDSDDAYISVDTIDVLGKQMECILLETYKNEVVKIYFKPGIGIVKFEGKELQSAYRGIATLKSYTLK